MEGWLVGPLACRSWRPWMPAWHSGKGAVRGLEQLPTLTLGGHDTQGIKGDGRLVRNGGQNSVGGISQGASLHCVRTACYF